MFQKSTDSYGQLQRADHTVSLNEAFPLVDGRLVRHIGKRHYPKIKSAGQIKNLNIISGFDNFAMKWV